MERFVKSWCTMGMPGTKPFFEGCVTVMSRFTPILILKCSLWAVFRLQIIPQKLGGAGRCRIEWEFDDAVFKEAA
jgi:hypothetical protein